MRGEDGVGGMGGSGGGVLNAPRMPARRAQRNRKEIDFFSVKSALPFSFSQYGVLAQLVERLNGIEEVRGSIPLGSKLRLVAQARGYVWQARLPSYTKRFPCGRVCPK